MQGASEKKADAGDGNEQSSDGQQPKKEETGACKSGKGQQKKNVSEQKMMFRHYRHKYHHPHCPLLVERRQCPGSCACFSAAALFSALKEEGQ